LNPLIVNHVQALFLMNRLKLVNEARQSRLEIFKESATHGVPSGGGHTLSRLLQLSGEQLAGQVRTLFEAYREGFAASNTSPTEEEFDEIRKELDTLYDTFLHSERTRLEVEAKRLNVHSGIPKNVGESSAPRLTAILAEFNVWRTQVALRDAPPQFSIAKVPSITALSDKVVLKEDLLQLQKANTTATIALLYIDLDNFKHVNTHKTHAGGDKVIEQAAALICGAVLHKGRVYRLNGKGGDEFGVILINHDLTEAKATGERIRTSVEAGQLCDVVSVTTSIGIAMVNHGMTPEDALMKADAAMYKAKEKKNTVSV
jgi:diguanylate cyclase (GGDEF)-like protein